MKMWQIAIAIISVLISTYSNAQNQPFYLLQKDDSVLKKKYVQQVLDKKRLVVASLGKENSSDYKKIYDEQFRSVSDLISSSRSVTTPEVHNYLQSVLRSIVDANKELKDLELRVLFSRDWWPNAYSMGEGTIMINAGLMVYLDTEAELVFVLCHELAHYYLDHSDKSVKKYVTTINSDYYQKELKRLSKEEYRVNQQLEQLAKGIVFDDRKHSRDHESEADRQAFNFMKKTGYDCNAIRNTLRILDVIDDTVLYQPLNVEKAIHFNTYPFRKKWLQKESSIFSKMGDDESPLSKKERDALRTHPDCEKRMLMLEDSINSVTGSRSKFLVDENMFRKLKEDFVVEMTEQCYRENNLSRNLYYSLVLLQEKVNTQFAIYSVARCLNRIYQHQVDHTLGKMIETENRNFPSDYNDLLRMISSWKLDEIAAICSNFCKHHFPEMKNYPGFDKEMSIALKIAN